MGYTAVNSAGHYAQLGQWSVVAAFGVLLLAAVLGAGFLLSRVTSPPPR